jgi:hypothetical protein
MLSGITKKKREKKSSNMKPRLPEKSKKYKFLTCEAWYARQHTNITNNEKVEKEIKHALRQVS